MHILDKLAKKYNAIITTDESAPESNRLKVIEWCKKEADLLEERGSLERKRGKSFEKDGKMVEGFLESRGWEEKNEKVKVILRAGRSLAYLRLDENGKPEQVFLEPKVKVVVEYLRDVADELSKDKTIDIYVKDSKTKEYTT